MSIFRELNAKKAKYGFTAHIGHSNLVEVGLFLATALRGAKLGHDFVLDSNQSGGSYELKLYTNDDHLAEHIRALNGLDLPSGLQAFLDGGNLFEKALAERYAVGDAPNNAPKP